MMVEDELGFNGLSALLGYFKPSPRERGVKDTDQSGITLLLWSKRLLWFFYVPGVQLQYTGPPLKVPSEGLG